MPVRSSNSIESLPSRPRRASERGSQSLLEALLGRRGRGGDWGGGGCGGEDCVDGGGGGSDGGGGGGGAAGDGGGGTVLNEPGGV